MAETARLWVPAPAALVAATLAGVATATVLPDAAVSLPRGNEPEPNATQLAATAAAVLGLTAAYLYVASTRVGLGRRWLVLALAYNAAIVVVKFILSPAAFESSETGNLGEYLWVGMVVMVLYGAGLVTVWTAGQRSWGWPGKVALVGALVLFAMASRYVAALVLGDSAADYLDRVFSGSGLWLPALIAAASAAALEAFESAGRGAARPALGIGLALVAVYHGLWALFMLRLF